MPNHKNDYIQNSRAAAALYWDLDVAGRLLSAAADDAGVSVRGLIRELEGTLTSDELVRLRDLEHKLSKLWSEHTLSLGQHREDIADA